MRKTGLLATIMLLVSTLAIAQPQPAEMADGLRTEGKIYVVVLVLATIFAGIIAFLIRLDRKITKLEKEQNQ